MTDPYDRLKVGDEVPPMHRSVCCAAKSPYGGYLCTRIVDHSGQHVADGSTRVRAVWPNWAVAS